MRAMIFFFLLLPAIPFAATYHIPADFATIQSAIDASVNGDSIVVAPGRYLDNLNFAAKSIVVTSQFGSLVTFLEPADTTKHLAQFSGGSSELSGFAISRAKPNHAIDISQASPKILRNSFTDCGSPYAGGAVVYSGGISNFTLSRNQFWNNLNSQVVVFVTDSCYPIITNNTIYIGRSGITLWSNAYLTGNTVAGCISGISASKPIYHNYNNSWGNSNYNYGFTPASGDISVNPEFVDSVNADLRLQSSSPLIDVGDTAFALIDPDGSRNDIGAFPFNKNAAIAGLRVDATNQAHVLSAKPIFTWLPFSLPGTQTAYEIEVGTDFDWSTAEMWDSGPVTSESNAVTYAGSPLVRGITYTYRVRILSWTIWGDWEQRVFTYNGLPSAPTPVAPVGGAIVSVAGLKLNVANSSDPNGDKLTYDFELYSDASGSVLVQSCYGIAEQTSQTASADFAGLDSDRDYWWKSRAKDSYEYGEWSSLVQFRTRLPKSVLVPTDYATIQLAIDAVSPADTVQLTLGTFSGDGNRDIDFHGKNLVLKSWSGLGTVTIDCEGTASEPHRAFYLHSGEDTTAVIEGIVITNAESDAAIRCIGAGVTIRRCIITKNRGKGLLYLPNYPTRRAVNIDSSFISDNTGTGVDMSDGRITACEFSGNIGDGLNMWDPDNASVTGCLFRNNPSVGIHYITLGGQQPSFSNCTFVGNRVGMVYEWTAPAGETALLPSAPDWNPGWVSNCVFAFNDSGLVSTFITPSVSCCNSFGNRVRDWPGGINPGDSGNISEDPMFCDTAMNNFHLMSSSPCLPANNLCGVQMGAFDVGCECCTGYVGNVNMRGIVDLSDLTMLIGYLTGIVPSLPCWDEANINTTGIVDLSDLSGLLSYLTGGGWVLPNCP